MAKSCHTSLHPTYSNDKYLNVGPHMEYECSRSWQTWVVLWLCFVVFSIAVLSHAWSWCIVCLVIRMPRCPKWIKWPLSVYWVASVSHSVSSLTSHWPSLSGWEHVTHERTHVMHERTHGHIRFKERSPYHLFIPLSKYMNVVIQDRCWWLLKCCVTKYGNDQLDGKVCWAIQMR